MEEQSAEAVLDAQDPNAPADTTSGAETKTPTEDLTHTYLKVLIWPILIAGVFQISALYNENQALLIVVAHAAVIGLVVAKALQDNMNWQTAAVIGGVAGAASSLVVALYKVITAFHLIYIFNLFTQPIFNGVLDAIATGFIFLLAKMFLDKQSSKGGEQT